MDQPWGISGPAFVWFFIALLIAPLILRLLLGTAVKRSAVPQATPGYGRPLSVCHLAYLAGGTDRAIETVIAALVDRGELRVNSAKKLQAVGNIPVDPLERAVADAANDAVGSTAVGIKNWVRPSEAMKALIADLEVHGLVVPSGKDQSIRRTVFAVYLAVFTLGAARWANGISLNRPVGLLTALLVVSLVAVWIAWRATRRQHHAAPTAAGARLLAQARSERLRAGQTGAGSQDSWGLPLDAALVGAAGAVALGGLAMYPDEELSAALMPPPGNGGGGSSTGGSSCGSSSCSSASSCSSGSSCGGGGGCGG
jgi:uncharacterized protein (TIGR04222 family)